MRNEDSDHEEISFEDRYVLQDRYIELTRTILPAEGRRQAWSLQEDHCFMRVILDHLFEDCWYNHLDKRLVAYKQLNNDQLKIAIGIAEQIMRQGEGILKDMNTRSLQWRGQR